MDRADIAQKLLQRVVAEERADEIIGDFLETHAQATPISFSLAFVCLFLSFAWRPFTAFIAAVFIGLVSWSVLFEKASRQLWLGQVHNSAVLSHAIQYVTVSAPLWAIAALTLVRFGVRDRLWIISAVYAGVTSAAVYSYWIPLERPIVWVGLGAAVVTSLSTDIMRRASLIVASLLALGLVVSHYQGAIIGQALSRHRTATTIGISVLLNLFSVPFAQAVVCVALHRRITMAKPSIAT
jgi:hypothetical protein